MRELTNLKRMADYSSTDTSRLSALLSSIDPEFIIYSFDLLAAGVDKDSICDMSDDKLLEYGIPNSLHRQRILDWAKSE